MSERKWNLDVIRIISCFLVIAIHVVDYGLEIQTVMSMDWISRVTISSISRCSVPAFFMLSGMLFMEKDISIKTLWKKYIFRIFIAWLLWSSGYAVIDYVAALKKGDASLEYLLTRILSGHYHLWFIPVLLTAYVFLPILQKILKACSDNEIKYLGLIILIAVVGKETLNPFLNSPVWDGLWKNISVPGASEGIIYFVMGYYLKQWQDKISDKACWILFIAGGFVAVLRSVCWGWYTGDPVSDSYSYLSLDHFCCAAGFFLLGLKMSCKIKVSEKMSRFLAWVSGHTFGIYLIHAVFIEQVYRRVGLSASSFPVWISPLFFILLTFGCSFAVVWILKKIPFFGKWIV